MFKPDLAVAADQQVAQNIYNHLLNYFQASADLKNANVQSQPAVSVSVDGVNFQYQLTEDDIYKVFSRYGSVSSVQVNVDGSSAVIYFARFDDAQTAIKDLNGKLLNGVQGSLRVSWYSTNSTFGLSDLQSQPPPLPPSSCTNTPCWDMGIGPFGTPETNGLFNGNNMAMNMYGGAINYDDRVIRKYTCRFEIGIENDKEFHVARRIIGQKGANMKRIVKLSEAKLRLRGKGSGFLEGTNKQESAEPLHLCISCKDFGGYRIAVQQVDLLLQQIYEEYRMYCEEKGLPAPKDLRVNVKEHPLMSSASSLNAQQMNQFGSYDFNPYSLRRPAYQSCYYPQMNNSYSSASFSGMTSSSTTPSPPPPEVISPYTPPLESLASADDTKSAVATAGSVSDKEVSINTTSSCFEDAKEIPNNDENADVSVAATNNQTHPVNETEKST